MIDRLIQEIAYGGTERPGQDEGRPEQQDVRHAGPVISRRDRRQCSGEDEGSAFVSEAGQLAIQSPRAVPNVWENVMAVQ